MNKRKENNMKVLVTAFKPFYKSINNYSMEVLEYIKKSEISK